MSGFVIMRKLEDLRGRYLDQDKNDLLIGGLNSYITPQKYVTLAEKYGFAKYKSYHIDDEGILDDIRKHLEANRMVIIAAWTKENSVDLYLEPSSPRGSGFVISDLNERRLGFGSIKHVSKLTDNLVLVCSNVNIAMFDLRSEEMMWKIDCLATYSAFSADGKLLALVTGQDVLLWNVGTLTLVHKLQVKSVQVAFSPDGCLLASGGVDGTVRLWDVKSGREVRYFEGHTALIQSIAFSPDAQFLASGSSDKTLRVWDLNSGQELSRLEGHTAPVRSVAFSPDGLLLASGSSDKTIRIWDLTSGSEKQKLEHANTVTSVAFNNNGNLLASGSWDKTVQFWNLSTGDRVKTLQRHTGWVYGVFFVSMGSLVWFRCYS